MIQTFFNPEIIAASWPIVLAGLRNTVLLSLLVVPLGTLPKASGLGDTVAVSLAAAVPVNSTAPASTALLVLRSVP